MSYPHKAKKVAYVVLRGRTPGINENTMSTPTTIHLLEQILNLPNIEVEETRSHLVFAFRLISIGPERFEIATYRHVLRNNTGNLRIVGHNPMDADHDEVWAVFDSCQRAREAKYERMAVEWLEAQLNQL